LSRPVESNKQQVPATPFVAPLTDINGIPSTVLPLASVQASNLPVLNESSAIYEASPALIPKSSLAALSGGFSALDSPDSPPSPHIAPVPNSEPLSLLGSMSPKGLSNNAALMRLHHRRLVDNGNMYLPNAILQSLVYCLPFRDLFRGLGHLVGQCEGGEAAEHVTPLIDTTVRFLNEFAYKEKLSVTHQVARGELEEDGKKGDDGIHSLLSTHVYDAMKEKRQFIMRVRSCVHLAAFFF
jgi:ubiquitin carboxyl-terminal hydrolase 10